MPDRHGALDLSVLLASTVHDMKNSLGIVLDAAEQLGQAGHTGGLPASVAAIAANRLQFEGRRLNNNLLQLLALYRIDHGQYFANIAEVNVYDMLEEVVLDNESASEFSGIELGLDCDRELSWFVDRALVLGVLNTVTNNAYRYAKRRILMSALVMDDTLVLSLSDDGEGYPDALLNNDRKALDFVNGNTGLGLYFADKVAGMHSNGRGTGAVRITNGGVLGGACLSLCLPK